MSFLVLKSRNGINIKCFKIRNEIPYLSLVILQMFRNTVDWITYPADDNFWITIGNQHLMSKSTSFFKPWIKYSYSTILFVPSNSNLLRIQILFLLGSIKMQPAPTPSLDFDPSKCKVQVELSRINLLCIIYTWSCLSTLSTTFLDKESCWIWTTFKIYDWWLWSEKGVFSSLKFPKSISYI